MKSTLAVLGLVIALAGLGTAVFQDSIRGEQATSIESLGQDAMDKGTEIWSGKDRFRKDGITYAYIGLGLVGFVLGLAALLKNENKGMALGAMVAGGVAMGWYFIVNLLA